MCICKAVLTRHTMLNMKALDQGAQKRISKFVALTVSHAQKPI